MSDSGQTRVWSVRQARGTDTNHQALLVARTDGTPICAEDAQMLDRILNNTHQFDGGVSTLCELGEACIPTDVVEVCGYIDETGHMGWVYRVGGPTELSRLIGMLELAKHHVINTAWDGPDGETDSQAC